MYVSLCSFMSLHTQVSNLHWVWPTVAHMDSTKTQIPNRSIEPLPPRRGQQHGPLTPDTTPLIMTPPPCARKALQALFKQSKQTFKQQMWFLWMAQCDSVLIWVSFMHSITDSKSVWILLWPCRNTWQQCFVLLRCLMTGFI